MMLIRIVLSSIKHLKRFALTINNFKIKILFCVILFLSMLITFKLMNPTINHKVCELSHFDYSQKGVKWTKYPIVPHVCQNKIIIIALPRSGSSFLGTFIDFFPDLDFILFYELGNLVQKSWPTFYVFEPLHYLGQYVYGREIENNVRFNKSMDVLTNLFKCEKLFATIRKSQVIWRPKWWARFLCKHAQIWISFRNNVMEGIKKSRKKNKKVSNTKYVCERCKNILIKTVRIDIEYLVKFYHHFNSSKV